MENQKGAPFEAKFLGATIFNIVHSYSSMFKKKLIRWKPCSTAS